MTNFSYEVFSEVARQKTFIAAAKQLQVTPSAISHSINSLEKDLGFSLFVRPMGLRETWGFPTILILVLFLQNSRCGCDFLNGLI